MDKLYPNGVRILELRSKAGLTQQQLADIIGCAVQNVYRAEKGRPMRRSTLAEIAQGLTKSLKRQVKLEDIVITKLPPSLGPDARPSLWAYTAVLIPAYGMVPEGVFINSNVDSICMVPLAGRPIIYWQMKYLGEIGCRVFRIAVRKRGTKVEDFVHHAFKDVDVDFVLPDADRGPGYTVTELLRSLRSSPPKASIDSVLVVLGDTLFRLEDTEKPTTSFALIHQTTDSHRWARFGSIQGPDGPAARPIFVERGQPADFRENYALIGAYYFAQLDAAVECAEELARNGGVIEITRILNSLADRGFDIDPISAKKWYDAGHADLQILAHQDLLQDNSTTRGFHYVRVDARRGTITKGVKKDSGRVESFVAQIDYLRLLPHHYSPFFPRLLQFDDRWPGVAGPSGQGTCVDGPSYEMDYCSGSTLSDLYIFGMLHPDAWAGIFQRLRYILDEFGRQTRPVTDDVVMAAYWQKTINRLNRLRETAARRRCREDDQIIGILERRMSSTSGTTGLFEFLESEVQPAVRKLAARTTTLCVSHCDLCFSNIIIDLPSGIIKLIDPRGSFGGMKGIYGAQQYDYAKLYHSVYGLYDAIVNDLFELDESCGTPKVTIVEPSRCKEICERFNEVFFDKVRVTGPGTLLLTALLFASMVPLHDDVPKRQVALLCRAVKLFEEWKDRGSSPLV